MNIQTFKKHLYRKEIDVIKSLNLEDSIVQDDIEYFVLASFFQSYIEGKRYLAENFTQSLWKWLLDKNHINQLLDEDSNIYNLFPSCGKIGLSGTTKLLCERLFLTEKEHIYRSVLSNIYNYRWETKTDLGWSDEKFVMSDSTVKYIAQVMPKNYDDLKRIFHFKKDKKFKRDADNVINLIKDAHRNPRTRWGCGSRGVPCSDPRLTDPSLDGDYEYYHFYSWLTHWNIEPMHPHFSKESSDLVAFKLTGYLNRLIEIAPRLECHKCERVLVPNWKYARKDGSAYSVTVFWCNNDTCEEHHKGIYINHCIKAGWCGSVIDQRINTEKCEHGLYVCNSEYDNGKICTGCCVKHYNKELRG